MVVSMNNIISSPVEKYAHQLESLMTKMTWLEHRRFSRELSNYQLTPPQFHTLLAIKKKNSHCTMGCLASETQQVCATITGIVDRLVERGWVTRYRNPKDRRTVLVYLTSDGHAKLDEVHQAQHHRLVDVVKNLDEQTCLNLTFSVQQYIHALEAIP